MRNDFFNQPLLLDLLPVQSPALVWVQLLTALFVGLLTAFALQLMLTSLGAALGLSMMRIQGKMSNSPSRHTALYRDSHAAAEESSTEAAQLEQDGLRENRSRPGSSFGIIAGCSFLITLNTVLLIASFLGTRLSQINDPANGAITGIVIWAAYCLLLLWISSQAVGSVVGSVLDITTGGFRRLTGAIAAAFTSTQDEAVTEEQMLDIVRQEMQTALKTVNLPALVHEQVRAALPSAREPHSRMLESEVNGSSETAPSQEISPDFSEEVATYLYEADPKRLTPKRMERKLQKILSSIQEESMESEPLPTFDRDALAEILDYRDDLSDKQKNRVLDRLEGIWNQFAEESVIDEEDHTASDSVQETSGSPPISIEVLQTVSDVAMKQVMANLPALLHRLEAILPNSSLLNASGIAPVILTATLTHLKDGLAQSENSLPFQPEQVKQTLEDWTAQSQSSLSNLNQTLETQIEQWRDRTLNQIETLQQGTQDRLETWKQQAQQRVEETRKIAGMAAWWLFMTIFTGALSAALAGAVATGWDVTRLVSLIRHP